jgi:hypothetical protein
VERTLTHPLLSLSTGGICKPAIPTNEEDELIDS